MKRKKLRGKLKQRQQKARRSSKTKPLCALDQRIWAVLANGEAVLTGVSYGEANTFTNQSALDKCCIVTAVAASRIS